MTKLTDPFDAKAIGKLPRVTCPLCRDSKGRGCEKHKVVQCRTCKNRITEAHLHLDYVGHAHVTERLLAVDPSWSWEPLACDTNGLPILDANGGLWIRLTVNGVSRPGYGDAEGKRGGNAVKEAIGDALRNAAMRFGVALELWKKETSTPVEQPPEPAAQRKEEEPPPQTEGQIKAGLRVKIRQMHERRGLADVNAMADDFKQWSVGTEIGQADVAMLRAYVEALGKEST